MEVLAHRLRTSVGQAGNSLENARALYDMGVRWIEADARFTHARRIIINHPGIVFDESVMDLDTLLNFLKDSPEMYCCLDLKQNSRLLVTKIVKEIARYDLQDRIYLTAFQRSMSYWPLNIESDGQLLIFAKKICPEIKTHVIVTWPSNLSKIYDKYKPDAMSFGWLQEPPLMEIVSRSVFKALSLSVNLKEQIAEMRLKGIKVWAGIFNNPDDMLYFAKEMDVNGIMTDVPQILIDLIKAQKIS